MALKPSKNLVGLGAYLKSLRLDLGLSLRQASKLASISPAHLCKIEQGNNFNSIGLDVLLKLSRVYKIPISVILHKGGLISEIEDNLPPLASYLRHKYQLNPQAVRDIEITLAVVKEKYGLGTPQK